MNVVFDDHTYKPALEQVADALIAPIDVLGELALQLLHEIRNVAVRRLDRKMEMRRHLRPA
jgi:hypothetical protein